MVNYVKYSTNAQTKALKMGNFWLGTVNDGKGPTSSTGYYTALNPPSGGFTIYANKVSNGPSIYQATNESQLVSITNQLGGTSFTTSAQCLTWYVTQTDKFCVNREYEGIVTNGLVLNIDAGFTPSYPTTGNTWYDVSSGGNNGTLTNGPTFSSSNGGVIILDGIDDRVNAPSSSVYDFTNNSSFTLETFCYATTQSSSGMIALIERYSTATGFGGYTLRLRNYTTNYPIFTVLGTPSGSTVLVSSVGGTTQWVPNTWYHIVGTKSTDGVMKIYVNGVLEGTTTGVTNTPLPQTGVTLKVGTRGDTNDQYSNQRFGICRIYNRALTAAEVLQNYKAQKGRFGL